jgi:hypothetical protein
LLRAEVRILVKSFGWPEPEDLAMCTEEQPGVIHYSPQWVDYVEERYVSFREKCHDGIQRTLSEPHCKWLIVYNTN